MRETLAGDDFLLLCGDLLFDIDLSKFLAFHRAHGGLATVLSHPNDHPFDSAILRTDKEGRVTEWLDKEEPREWYPNRVNAGLHLFSPDILARFTEVKKQDLDRDVLRPLIAKARFSPTILPNTSKTSAGPNALPKPRSI